MGPDGGSVLARHRPAAWSPLCCVCLRASLPRHPRKWPAAGALRHLRVPHWAQRLRVPGGVACGSGLRGEFSVRCSVVGTRCTVAVPPVGTPGRSPPAGPEDAAAHAGGAHPSPCCPSSGGGCWTAWRSHRWAPAAPAPASAPLGAPSRAQGFGVAAAWPALPAASRGSSARPCPSSVRTWGNVFPCAFSVMTLKTNFGCPAGGTASECRPPSYRPRGSHGPRPRGASGVSADVTAVGGLAVHAPPSSATRFPLLPQLPARAAPSSATAACASTTPWSATGFRTARTPGTRTTAEVSPRGGGRGGHGPTTAFLLPALQQLRGRHGDASPECSLPWIPDLWMWPRQRKIGLRLGFF